MLKSNTVSFEGSLILNLLRVPKKRAMIKRPILVQWFPPKKECLKFNIDGASRGNPSHVGCGGILEMRTAISFFLSLNIWDINLTILLRCLHYFQD